MQTTQEKMLAANYPEALCRMMLTKGISTKQLFKGTSLDPETLANPETEVSLEDYFSLIRNAREFDKDPGLGLKLGQALGVTAHGMLGLAAMSCQTLGESIELGSRFFTTRFPAMHVTCELTDEALIFTLKENFDLKEHRRFITESVFASIFTFGEFLIGVNVKRITTCFTANAGEAKKAYLAIFGDKCLFEQPSNAMICPKPLLTQPLRYFDPATKRLAEKNCSDALERLKERGGLKLQIKELIQRNDPEFYSIEGVAKKLNMSPRTISRKLKQADTSFQELLDDIRKQQAIYYLTETHLTITEISYQMSFNDSAYFARAFKKWTGLLPTEYRKRANIKTS